MRAAMWKRIVCTGVAGGAMVLMSAVGVGAAAAGTAAQAQVTGPYPRAHIYPTVEEARPEINAALEEARRTHRRVILDFGGDWCPDCQVLNIYFHQSPNKELLEKYFVLVDVNIGHMDKNVDVAHEYGVPLKGVPALAVLNAHGKVVYAQSKEFSDMRHLDSSALTEFLNKWKR